MIVPDVIRGRCGRLSRPPSIAGKVWHLQPPGIQGRGPGTSDVAQRCRSPRSRRSRTPAPGRQGPSAAFASSMLPHKIARELRGGRFQFACEAFPYRSQRFVSVSSVPFMKRGRDVSRGIRKDRAPGLLFRHAGALSVHSDLERAVQALLGNPDPQHFDGVAVSQRRLRDRPLIQLVNTSKASFTA